MLTVVEFLLPALIVMLIGLPLVNVFRGQASKKQAKFRLATHICLFFGVVLASLFVFTNNAHAAEAVQSIVGTNAQGYGFIAAAVATGLSALGAGIAVAGAAPAAIGAFSEDSKNFGKGLIFVALGEGVAIYGLLISILIINKI